jgi:hypothetical protein
MAHTMFCASAPKARAPATAVALNERHCGQTIEAPVGSVVLVRLRPLAGSGYSWAMEPIEESVRLVYEKTVLAENPSLSTDRDQLFRFEVRRIGMVVLRFQHFRPWERPPNPIAVCDFIMRILPR